MNWEEPCNRFVERAATDWKLALLIGIAAVLGSVYLVIYLEGWV